MSIEMKDLTGLPTLEDVERAHETIKIALIRSIATLPPDLAVELPNVLRCLQLTRAVLSVRKAQDGE